MTLALTEPSAAAAAVELADYLELRVFQADDGNASVLDLIRDLNVGGTAEVLDIDPLAEDGLADPQEEEALINPRGDLLEALGAAATAEIEGREAACGGAYPFSIDEHGVLTLKPKASECPYVFMLLLTRFGGKPKQGAVRVSHSDATKLFEDLATTAAASYFGIDHNRTLAYPFGFPRRSTPASFKAAINHLCEQMGEGSGCKNGPNLRNQKDGGLDVVVVRRFPDRKAGQLMGFGQCATGGDWREKLTDLQPHAFCDLWMIESPAVLPVRLFFVPHTVEDDIWLHTIKYAGVLFDRCRMAHYTTSIAEAQLRQDISDWNSAVLKAKVQA